MPETAISIKNANLFLNGKQILHEINLKIDTGKHYFILGPNGAGKTTLTRMILGYIWPKYGSEIKVLSNTYGSCDVFEVRKQIAWISPFLQGWINKGDWTVSQIVLSGKDSTVGLFRKPELFETDKVRRILSDLDILELENRKFNALSSGEQVKVLIAKALYSNPEIVILDEACVHLDIKSREQFLKVLENIADSNEYPATMIFITQRIEDIISLFESGILMKDGSIIASGNREDILTADNLKKLFDINLTLLEASDGRYWPVVGV